MLNNFFQIEPMTAAVIHGTYDYKLVCLSFLIAVLASYVTLDFTGKLQAATDRSAVRWFWLILGSLTMGIGIWSMHFIGMLSFVMPMSMNYDGQLTICSMLIAILASFLALFLLGKQNRKKASLYLGGLILGISIASMHYVGMEAMKSSMTVRYLPGLFILSILIAIIASEAALYLAMRSNSHKVKEHLGFKFSSAFIMGTAICGMHYTGMAATIMTPGTEFHAASWTILEGGVASLVSLVTLVIMGIYFIISSLNDVKLHHKIDLARQTGMAEIAATVLHNIGNVLNSINVGANLLRNRIEESELEGLVDLQQLVLEHTEDFDDFILNTEQGKEFPGYINLVAEYWQKEKLELTQEIERLSKHIQHIKNIIATQQTISGVSNYQEKVDVSALLNESLAITSMDLGGTHIQVIKNYSPLAPVVLDKIKLLQVLINLMQNAKQALVASSSSLKTLTIACHPINNKEFMMQISDNGIGISPEHKAKIFNYGFTTKKNGHGFGLHSGINMISEMGGSLSMDSEGVNKGACFTIVLPYKNVKLSQPV